MWGQAWCLEIGDKVLVDLPPMGVRGKVVGGGGVVPRPRPPYPSPWW